MKEKPADRLKRLRASKSDVLGRMKAIRQSKEGVGPVVRNADHKLSMLNDEVNRIGARIVKITDAIGAA